MPAKDRPWDENSRDDEDDRPHRRRRDEEDAEDRPRRRPRDGDDDDRDDRPRRRDGQQPKSNGGLIAVLVAVGVLGFCGIGGLVIIGLLLPAVQKVREAAARVSDANNMKRMGLAFYDQEKKNGEGFVGPYARDPRGTINRDLSFRVALLPYVDQGALYQKFELSQSWNSPRNQSASSTPVKEYTSPLVAPPSPTQTPYRVFYGGGALFNENGAPVHFAKVTDGTSNTILMVHAAETVPWAEPREFQYSPNAPLPSLGSDRLGGGNVLMVDGSVRFVNKTVSERTLRSAITRDGGEVLGSDW